MAGSVFGNGDVEQDLRIIYGLLELKVFSALEVFLFVSSYHVTFAGDEHLQRQKFHVCAR